MRAVWKFELPVTDRPVVEMPEGALVKSVACQGDRLCVWAMVDTDAPKVERAFRVFGTGHPLDPPPTGNFVGTALMMGGALVWHVWED